MTRIPVYFVPGLASSPLIFERIHLPEDRFETVILEWLIPLKDESIQDYARRLCQKVTHENPVLIGVSFGWLMVQEMSQIIKTRKVIIISSAKSNAEYPRIFKFARKTGMYKLFPSRLVLKIEHLAKYPFPRWIRSRLKLYKRYLGVHDVGYLRWSVRKVIFWDRTEPDKNVIHIHGDKDEIFPSKRIENYIPVKGGSHIMIINRFRWFNENLPKIILDGLK